MVLCTVSHSTVGFISSCTGLCLVSITKFKMPVMSILLHRFIMSCALQIDGSVVLVLTDEQLRFYLPAYGDRVATIAWLNSNGGNGTEFRPQSPLLSRLRLKIEKRNTLRAASCATTSTADRT